MEGKRALDEVSASMMAADLVKLQITTASGGSASMSVIQEEMLSLVKNKLSLKTGTGSLNIKGDGLSMEHSLKLSLKSGPASMDMNSMGTTIDGARIVNLKGKLLSFG
ncbi:MAG: hypothetical protein LBF22_04350 [Deltaproteobacteria bacterium]|jgi:hypothetical protein|nr:hypothetical protein [Deltaproteobacteria bacterium]